MNIREQVNLRSGQTNYRIALVDDLNASRLVVASEKIDTGLVTHWSSRDVGRRANRLSAGPGVGDGFYLTLQWAPHPETGVSDGTWYYSATEEFLSFGTRQLPGGMLSGHQANYLCNQYDGLPDRRMSIATNSYPTEIRIATKADAMRGGPRATSILRYKDIPDFPFDATYKPDPIHFFEVFDEEATIREMNAHGEYEYVFDLRGWPNNGNATPILVSHGPAPVPIQTGGISGDINMDGSVDSADLGKLIESMRTQDSAGDLNKDGAVDSADLGILIEGMKDNEP